jgi:very-short-patch-repair endonuclease
MTTNIRNTKNYKALPYNPALKDRARALRKAGILHEVLLWQQIKSRKLNNLDFDRQKIIGNYIVDFYCASNSLVIELDGSSHDGKADYDERRDGFLESLGLTVIHLLATDILQNLEGVMDYLKNHPALSCEKTTPSCALRNPPLRRRGITPALRATPPEEGKLDT